MAGEAHASLWPLAGERIERGLADTNPALRRQAASRLLQLPKAQASRLILKALVDSDEEVRWAAAQAALDLQVPEAGALVLSWLSDPEQRIRLVAAQLLRVAPTRDSVTALGRVLGDKDISVRIQAARALGASKSGDAVIPLLGHLDDKEADARVAVIEALAELRDQRAVSPLIGKIQDGQVKVRLAAVRALGELEDPRATSALILALRDMNEEVKVASIYAMGKIGSDGAIPTLIEALGQSYQVRMAAVDVLLRLGGDNALDALVREIGSGALANVSLPIIRRLTDQGVEKLAQCLDGQAGITTQGACVRALGSSGSERAIQPLLDALTKGAVEPQLALHALTELKAQAAIPAALGYLESPAEGRRQAALKLLLAVLDPAAPDGRVVDPVAQALKVPGRSQAELRVLVMVLGQTGAPRAFPILAPFVREESSLGARVAAIEALGKLGGLTPYSSPELDRVLLGALAADEAQVRFAAGVALGRVASAAALPELMKRLEQAVATERPLIATALGGALAKTRNDAHVERVFRLLERARGAERDALIEALGRARTGNITSLLLSLRKGALGDRAKLAESLGAHAAAKGELTSLLADMSPEVRANAAWALGAAGDRRSFEHLKRAVSDPDDSVSANAVGAMGRLSKRLKINSAQLFCSLLKDSRSFVRANALASLRLNSARCADVSQILQNDASAIVRAEAARLISSTNPNEAELRQLQQCEFGERDSQVALACAERPMQVSTIEDTVTVYVVPLGSSEPVPGAPFTLVRTDGLMRLGHADRRGALYEHMMPRGFVRLEISAAQALE